jgi:hypothetical protein
MITSSSTFAEVKAQYNDNLDWDGDITKARLALAAVRWLLVNRPASGSEQGRNFQYEQLSAEKDRLTAFVDSKSTGRVRAAFISGRALLR